MEVMERVVPDELRERFQRAVTSVFGASGPTADHRFLRVVQGGLGQAATTCPGRSRRPRRAGPVASRCATDSATHPPPNAPAHPCRWASPAPTSHDAPTLEPQRQGIPPIRSRRGRHLWRLVRFHADLTMTASPGRPNPATCTDATNASPNASSPSSVSPPPSSAATDSPNETSWSCSARIHRAAAVLWAGRRQRYPLTCDDGSSDASIQHERSRVVR